MPRVKESPELSVTLLTSSGQKLTPTMSACPAPLALGRARVTVPLEEGCWLSVVLWITVMELLPLGGGGADAEATAIVSLALALAFVESRTVIEAEKLPDAVGVPLIVPALLSERPPGKPLADQLYGETPPVAASVAEYAVPTVPAGRVVVEIVSVGAGTDDAPLNATISMP